MEITDSANPLWGGMKRGLWFLWSFLSFFSVADFLLTKQFISYAGDEGEYNPFLQLIISHVGVYGILYVKILFLSLMAICISKIKQNRVIMLTWVLSILMVIQGLVAAFGIFCLLET